MQIRIEGFELPGESCGPSPDSPDGYHNIYVGVQRRNRRDELLGLVRGDAPSATWTMDWEALPSPTGVDLKGPYIQGPPSDRFIYLSLLGHRRRGAGFHALSQSEAAAGCDRSDGDRQHLGPWRARRASWLDRSQGTSLMCFRAAPHDRMVRRGWGVTITDEAERPGQPGARTSPSSLAASPFTDDAMPSAAISTGLPPPKADPAAEPAAPSASSSMTD